MGIVYTAKELRKMARDNGFEEIRQRGSHLQVQHADGRKTTIPMHDKGLAKGTSHAIAKILKGGTK